MQAIVTKMSGRILSGEYFSINIIGAECNDEWKKYYPDGKTVGLQLSLSDYEYLEDPEKFFSEIAHAINTVLGEE